MAENFDITLDDLDQLLVHNIDLASPTNGYFLEKRGNAYYLKLHNAKFRLGQELLVRIGDFEDRSN